MLFVPGKSEDKVSAGPLQEVDTKVVEVAPAKGRQSKTNSGGTGDKDKGRGGAANNNNKNSNKRTERQAGSPVGGGQAK